MGSADACPSKTESDHNAAMPATRVAVVDDHQLVRMGLKQIIESQPDFSWAGEAKTGREALNLLRAGSCDVLLLDLSLPDMSGLDVLRQIKAHHDSVATLVLKFRILPSIASIRRLSHACNARFLAPSANSVASPS